jgi:dipeptidyl aminopeptidase/acylaminoacyl peptidase
MEYRIENTSSPHAISSFLFFFILYSLFFIPVGAHAADVEYISLQDSEGDTALMRKKTLGTEAWYQCAFSTGACTEVASTTKLSHAAPSSLAGFRSLLPSGATWLTISPDGRYLAFYIAATQSRGKRTFGVYDVQEQKTYTKDETLGYWDLLTEGIRIFSFSPDSKTLLYLDDIKNHPTLYKVDLASLSGSTLVSSKMFAREYDIADVGWISTDTLLFVANRDNPYAWALYEYTISSGALKKVADNVSYGVNLKKVGEEFYYAEASSKGVRGKIYNPSTKKVRGFDIPSSPALESNGKLVKSLKHGLSGVFLLESSKRSKTLLVWLHGGPFRQTSLGYHPYLSYNGYDWALEVARRSDVGVLKIDYPGSMGYGRPFAESLLKNVGVKDAKDTASAISDFAKRNGYTSVYLMGNSYGGYLALKLLVENPTLFKGAFSIAGVMDWTTMLTNLADSIFNVQFGGAPDETNYALYNNASVYNKVGNLTTQKIILMHGDADMTIPYRQSEGLSIYLNSINKTHSFITLPGEDHVFKKPESYELLCLTTLSFVGKADTGLCAI